MISPRAFVPVSTGVLVHPTPRAAPLHRRRGPAVVHDDDLSRLVGLPALQQIWLVDAPITDAGLAHLGRIPTLQALQLDGTRVTDDGLKHLAGLRALQWLWLQRKPAWWERGYGP